MVGRFTQEGEEEISASECTGDERRDRAMWGLNGDYRVKSNKSSKFQSRIGLERTIITNMAENLAMTQFVEHQLAPITLNTRNHRLD